MGKLNIQRLRYQSKEEMRVLTALELGSRNHDVVPVQLIASISGLGKSVVIKILKELVRNKLISYETSMYDGYRLTYPGYDALALKSMANRDTLVSVGNQIGVGKESDIYIVADGEDTQMALKFQRLGRTSFRAIKSKRDYLRNRRASSWLYLSRLAAQKEFAFMKVLYDNGFPVPRPVDQNRHAVVMQLCDGYPMHQVKNLADPSATYSRCMSLIVKLAQSGLIHGDFNEFNIMVGDDDTLTMIDFPQMVSIDHKNAEWYFERDVNCIREFFSRRYSFEGSSYPKFKDIVREANLDLLVEASGFTKKKMAEFDELTEEQVRVKEELGESDSDDGETDSEEDEDSDDDDDDEAEEESNAAAHSDRDVAGAASGVAMVSIDGEHVVTDNSTDEESEEDEDSDSEAVHENTNKTFKPFRDTKDKSTTRGPRSKSGDAPRQALDEAAIRDKVKKDLAMRNRKPAGHFNMAKDRKKQNINDACKNKSDW